MCNVHTTYVLLHLCIVKRTLFRVVAYDIAKVRNICCIASNLQIFWYGSTEWNIEENFSMESNMKWTIFSMEWKKIARMDYGKIIFHSMPGQ